MTGTELGGRLGDLFIMCTALFPAIDPILIIYCVRAFVLSILPTLCSIFTDFLS